MWLDLILQVLEDLGFREVVGFVVLVDAHGRKRLRGQRRDSCAIDGLGGGDPSLDGADLRRIGHDRYQRAEDKEC